MTVGDMVMLLELARTLADLEEARRQVAEGGAFVLTKASDLTENPWAGRERKLRAQSIQLRKSLVCLDAKVVSCEAEAEA